MSSAITVKPLSSRARRAESRAVSKERETQRRTHSQTRHEDKTSVEPEEEDPNREGTALPGPSYRSPFDPSTMDREGNPLGGPRTSTPAPANVSTPLKSTRRRFPDHDPHGIPMGTMIIEDNEDRSGFHPEVPFDRTARKAPSEYSNISNNYDIEGDPNEDLSDLGMDEFEAKMQAMTAELEQQKCEHMDTADDLYRKLEVFEKKERT